MQPPTNFSDMPEFYSGSNYPMPEPEENTTGRARKRSSSAPSTNDKDGVSTGQQQIPFSGNLQTDIAKMAWEAGSNQVKRAFFLYTNIDIFRPYFDVEPKQVRNRLIQSLIPRTPSSMQSMGADLYGPVMLIFTLVAILLYSMKTSGFQAKDGTLIGTAFFTCFTYWFFASLGVYTLGYVFVSRIAMLQTFSILGYALFSHCLVLGMSSLAHHIADSHTAFYVFFALFGGLSSLRMAIYFASKTPAKTHKIIIASVVVALHLGFLLYLHFGYHKVVEEINEMLGNEMLEQQPAAILNDGLSLTKAPPLLAFSPTVHKPLDEVASDLPVIAKSPLHLTVSVSPSIMAPGMSIGQPPGAPASIH